MEPLCGTLRIEQCRNGTFMWNLGNRTSHDGTFLWDLLWDLENPTLL